MQFLKLSVVNGWVFIFRLSYSAYNLKNKKGISGPKKLQNDIKYKPYLKKKKKIQQKQNYSSKLLSKFLNACYQYLYFSPKGQ